MNQKSSLREVPHFVSGVLTGNKRQDLGEQALAIDRLLISVISQPNATRNQETEQALRAQALGIANQIKELDRLIATQFPEYAALVTKSPISIEEVQRRLNPNEALLLFTTTSRFTFVWPNYIHISNVAPIRLHPQLKYYTTDIHRV